MSSPEVLRLLTAQEVAELFQVDQSHVYRLARRGAIPCVRLGSDVRFSVDALTRWVRAGSGASEVLYGADELVGRRDGRRRRRRAVGRV